MCFHSWTHILLTKLNLFWTIFWTSESCVTCFSAPDGPRCKDPPIVHNPNESKHRTVTTFATYTRNERVPIVHNKRIEGLVTRFPTYRNQFRKCTQRMLWFHGNQKENTEIGPFPTNLVASQPVQTSLFWTRKVSKLKQNKKHRKILCFVNIEPIVEEAPIGRRMSRQNTRFFWSPSVPGKDF